MEEVDGRSLKVGRDEKKERFGQAFLIVRAWGAAMLRPYMSVVTDGFAARLTGEILRFARDDGAFYFDDELGGGAWDGLGRWGGGSLDWCGGTRWRGSWRKRCGCIGRRGSGSCLLRRRGDARTMAARRR